MDRETASIVVMNEELQEKISNWALNLDFRIKIYFYGSRLKGTHSLESDYDLAIEFLDAWIHRTLRWMDYHDQWQNELSKITDSKVHLELYDAKNVNVRRYVNDKSVTIFESPERPETNDEEYQ